jgi:hypothetical protein
MVLNAVHEALANPSLAERLLALCERNERAVEQFRAEQNELACLRAEHERRLAQTRRENDERLAKARAEWAAEEAARRKILEAAEAEATRRREFAAKDREAAAALRCKLEQKFAPAHRALGEFQQQWKQDPNLTAERAREKAAARVAEN